MKILFTRFPLTSAYGGAEVQTMALMRGLLKRGHAVAFLGSCPTLLSLCREEGIPAAELDVGPPPVTKWGAVSFAWRAPLIRRRLRSALASFMDLDAVCMLSLTEKLVLTEDAAARGIRVLWIEHDRVGRWLYKNPWLQRLLTASRSAVVVTVSELSRKLYERIGFPADHLVAIPNGIDPARVGDVSPPQPVPGRLRVGCVARLSPEKGVDVLIRAAAGVPEVSVDIVGAGYEKVALRRLGMELAVSERIAFLPPDSSIGDRFAEMDVLALPSRDHDPFGLVAAEAMMCGIPAVVTTACGIADELTDGEDALVVEADSAEALTGALRALLDPETRARIGEAGRRTAQAKFSVDMMVERYEALLG